MLLHLCLNPQAFRILKATVDFSPSISSGTGGTSFLVELSRPKSSEMRPKNLFLNKFNLLSQWAVLLGILGKWA